MNYSQRETEVVRSVVLTKMQIPASSQRLVGIFQTMFPDASTLEMSDVKISAAAGSIDDLHTSFSDSVVVSGGPVTIVMAEAASNSKTSPRTRTNTDDPP